MAANGIISPFLGALQACVSVLLTLSYGVLARRFKLIQEASINDVTGICVKLFFPALLIINLGDQLHSGNALNYIPVLAWAIFYTSLSILLGHAITTLLKLPPWVTPACSFNNTTSLPLLLLQSLKSVGTFKLIVHDEPMSESVRRAQSYFLACAVTTKVIAYIAGPRMLQDVSNHNPGEERGETEPNQPEAQHSCDGPSQEEHADEETVLLPGRAQWVSGKVGGRLKGIGKYLLSLFPKNMKQELAAYDSPFVDVAIICTITGAILGLVPKLHTAFFEPYEKGGIFNAWLTSSIENIGGLFTSLQVFMVGCKLGVSLEKMKASESSGKVAVKGILTIFIIRLVMWPVLSISTVYLVARNTRLLGDDPMLWFSLMVMPAGPPALIISGVAELGKVSEEEKIALSKALAILYALSPTICFTITGALKASEAILKHD